VEPPLDRAVCLPQLLFRTIRISHDGKRTHSANMVPFGLDTADVLARRRPRPSVFKLSSLGHQRILGQVQNGSLPLGNARALLSLIVTASEPTRIPRALFAYLDDG
jgi:hypothetical protein